jgi:TP901 family phage tail tape measure protein
MAIGNDIITLEVKVKASDAHAEMSKLQKELSTLRDELTEAGKSSDEFTKDERYRALIERINELHGALKKQDKEYAKDFKENEKTFMELIKARFKEETASVKELQQLQRHLRAKQSGTREGSDEWKQNIKDLTEVEIKLEKIKAEMKQVKAEMKLDGSIFKDAGTIAKLSFDKLKTAAEALEIKLHGLTPATTEYIETSKRLSLVNARIKELGSDYDNLNKKLIDGKQILNSALGYAAGEVVSEGLQVVENTLSEISDDVIAYGKSLSELEAITGASGEALKDLESRAESLTTITTEGGKVISNTATDILKAFKLVGSAKPELLGNAEALEYMTKKTIIFSKASGLELPEAVKYLSSTMAQFNATADQSGRYINAIAAGAKEGATEIPDITTAIEEFGAGAASANFSIEESVALVETLGDKMIKGGEAGTALRNILIAIKAPDALGKEAQAALRAYGVDMNLLKDNTKSGGERLKELSKIVNDASAMVTVFGKENVTAAEVLLRNTKRFDDLTKAVTGTNEAERQAAAMTNNLGNDMDNLKKTSTQLFGEFARSGTPVIRQIVQGFTNFLKSIKDNWDTIVGYTKAISTAVITVSSYYATVKLIPIVLQLWASRQLLLTAVTTAYHFVVDILTSKIARATLVQQAFNLVTRLNPIGLVVSAMTAAVGVWAMYSSKISEATQAQRQINELNATAQKNIAAQKIELEQYLAVARDEKRSKDERIAAVKKLNELSPQYLGNLTLEKINTDEATKAVNNYVSSLEKRAKSEAAFQKRTELEKELIDLKTGQTDVSASFGQQTLNFIKSGGNSLNMAGRNALSFAENYNQKLGETQKRIESLNKYIAANQVIDPKAPVNTPSVSTNNFVKGADKDKKEIELLAGSVAFLQEQLSKLNKEFENSPDAKTPEIINKIRLATDKLWEAEDKLEKLRKEAFGRTVEEVKQLDILKAPKQDVPKLNLDVQLAKTIADEKLNIERERRDKELADEEAHRAKMKDLLKAGLEAAQIASDAIFQIQAQNSERRKNEELKRIEDVYKKRLDKAKGNQKEQDKINKEMDAKKLQIEKEAFERDKKRSILQAIMNGALAISKILAEYPKFDFGIMTAIGIGLAAATTAAQVAVISNQKFAKGGIVQGASHTEGGIKLYDTKSKSIVGEMEGDEPYLILSKNTYKNNRQLVDALIDSSTNRNGAAVMANGGIVLPNASASRPIQSYVVNSTGPGNNTTISFESMLIELRQMREAFDRFPRDFKGYILYQDLKDSQDLVEQVKNKAFGR